MADAVFVVVWVGVDDAGILPHFYADAASAGVAMHEHATNEALALRTSDVWYRTVPGRGSVPGRIPRTVVPQTVGILRKAEGYDEESVAEYAVKRVERAP